MRTYDTTLDGYKFLCFYDYEPEIAADELNPKWDAVVTITEVFINDSKEYAYELVNPAVIQQIEAEILECLHE